MVVGVLVVPAVLLSALALSLLKQLESLGSRSWSEYGAYLAELSINHGEKELWDEEQRLMVATRADPPESMADIPGLLAELGRNPAHQLAFFVRPDHNVVFPPEATWQERTEAPVLRALDPVYEALELEAQGPAPLHNFSGDDRGNPYQVTYFTLRSWQDEILGAVVLVWDLGYMKEVVLPRIFARGPPSGKEVFRAGYLRDHITICLMDEHGELIFENQPQLEADLIAEKPFSRVLSFWRLGVRLEDREFRAWIRNFRTTHLFLIGGMLFVIFLGGILILRWINREIELAELKSHFVANVSHEIRTPIALIRLYAETLELGRVKTPAQMREYLQVISRETQRLTHLINNVLDMSRIDAGRKTYNFAQGDLGQIVHDTLESYDHQLGQQGFQVARRIEPGRLPANLDPEAITQALINLLDNAVKYSNGAQEKEIEVSLERRGNRALISVRDRGMGIPEEEQERIFDLFYRVNDRRVHGVKGSGLGLTLVQHIVGAHGGKVQVSSEPGAGSTFTIELPLSEGDGEPDA
jgi:signal transduction histidine kinase